MENLSLCRICLATDVRLCLLSSHLRDIYERITAMTFKREDRRPLLVCYICQARLQYCYRLRTSCLQSEELLTDVLSSGVLKPQDVVSTNTFRVVSVLNLSLGHAQQDITECHIKEEPSEFIWVDLEQPYTEDIVTEAQVKQSAVIDDNNQCSHLEDSLVVIKKEVDDFETDSEYINLEEGNIKIEEIDWEPDIAGPSSQSAGARVSKKSKIAALEDSEDATTNTRKIEIIKDEQTETITIKEPRFITKKIKVEKLTTNKILETCDKVDINLYNCDDNVLTSVKSQTTNDTNLEQNVSSISSKKNKLFSCHICRKCFIQKGHLKTHILTHTGEKPYQCNICNKCFTYKSVLKTHILTHSGEKPYQCNICTRCFVGKGDLNRHILTHTSEKQNQCNVCNKYFSSKQVLKQHIRTHTGEKPFQCNICKKSFVGKGDLKRHILTHTGEKQYQCNVCNKSFSSKQVLKQHIRTHTGEKPYKCNICMKCFIQRSILKRHILTHTGKKQHQCKVCNKSFVGNSDLNRHIRTHTGEQPYQCNICKKRFSDSSSFSRHNRIHKR